MSDASPLELALTTVALVSSLVLTTVASLDNPSVQPEMQLVAATLAAFSAVGVGLTALVLAWFKEITLGALSSAIIGLIPTTQVIPQLKFGAMRARIKLRHVSSLCPPEGYFKYARYGLQCECTPHLAHCTGRKYIRRQAASWVKHPGFDEPRYEAWHGWVVQTNAHCVEICDMRDGDAYRWWCNVSNAMDLVLAPQDYFLISQQAALNALALAADIIVVGDLVFKEFHDELQERFQSDADFKDGLGSSPGSLCNKLLEKLELPWKLAAHEDTFPALPAGRAQKYGTLFFMLTEKSHLFQNRAPDTCGFDIVNEYWNSGEVKQFIRTWLSGWGLDLKNENEPGA